METGIIYCYTNTFNGKNTLDRVFVMEHSSFSDAARHLGCSRAAVSKCVVGKIHLLKGFKFEIR